MNKYIDLNRIEFVITNACTGRCKHCGNGERSVSGDSVKANAAVNVVKQLAKRFAINSVMTFGGEPLLFAETVCKIHAAARDGGISKRQLITNGFFSKDEHKIDEVAKAICESGVNDILLSVDVFHQEFIPLEPVMQFADALLKYNAPRLRVQPAWVVNEQHENTYNTETKQLLKMFTDKGISANEGNNIYPSGNALKYLGDYFLPPGQIDLSALCGSTPYTTRLDEIKCFGINPNGDVNLCSITIGNIYKDDIMDIVDLYDPYNDPASRAVLNGGVSELLRYAQSQDITMDTGDCRSACGVCRKVMTALKEKARAL
ncbi:MAG: radical SAM protein [Eubacteriales bacterium]|nr:radical SAM protein [Eubacteriales bacterium]